MSDHFILQDKKPVPVDLMTWAKWLEDRGNRDVAKTDVGNLWVSTVFLGLDHSFGEGPPILFETWSFPKENGTNYGASAAQHGKKPKPCTSAVASTREPTQKLLVEARQMSSMLPKIKEAYSQARKEDGIDLPGWDSLSMSYRQAFISIFTAGGKFALDEFETLGRRKPATIQE